MSFCSRRTIVGALLVATGCGRLHGPTEEIISEPLPGSNEVLDSGNLRAVYRFHRRNEGDRLHNAIDLWSDSKFVVNSTALLRYEYQREGGSLERKEMVRAFLAPFKRRTPELARRLEDAAQPIATSGVWGGHAAFQEGQLVGDIELLYHEAREGGFLTIGLYENRYYDKYMQTPGGAAPERVLPFHAPQPQPSP